jgi:hypothetical protein
LLSFLLSLAFQLFARV